MIDQKQIRIAHGLMVFATIIVATSFVLMGEIAGKIESSALTLLRFAISVLLFLPVLAIWGDLKLPSLERLSKYSVLGLCQAIFFWAMFEALRFTTSINTAVLYTFVPLLSAVIAYFLLRERLGVIRIAALLCAFAAALVVITKGDMKVLLGIGVNKGDAIFLISVAALGIYSPLINYFSRGEQTIQMTFWTIVTATVWLTFFAYSKLDGIPWGYVDVHVYGVVIYLALFATIGTFFMLQYSSLRIGPTRMMAYAFLNPSCVLAINLMSGNSNVEAHVLAGVVLTVVASLFLQKESSANDSKSAG